MGMGAISGLLHDIGNILIHTDSLPDTMDRSI